jgi:hypothetical protein
MLLIGICFCLAAVLRAQRPNAAPTSAVPNESLKIVALVGQGAVNNVRVPTPTDLVVEVRDEDDRPVEGATVSFQLPLMGASGGFEGGVRNKEAVTNVQGQASVSYAPNMELGRFTIQVKATQGGRTGMTSIVQQNSIGNEPGQKRSWLGRHKTIVILAVVAVAGAGIAIALTRGGSSSTSTSTPSGSTGITITPGVPTVGAPH